jgi:transposase
MGQNFIACDREQSFLLPPDVREWLPEDHFAWFVLDAVAQMDLAAFYGAYRADGHGRAAFDPGMVVALLLYAYARGTRSSRDRARMRGGRRLPGDRRQSGPGPYDACALSPAPPGRVGGTLR